MQTLKKHTKIFKLFFCLWELFYFYRFIWTQNLVFLTHTKRTGKIKWSILSWKVTSIQLNLDSVLHSPCRDISELCSSDTRQSLLGVILILVLFLLSNSHGHCVLQWRESVLKYIVQVNSKASSQYISTRRMLSMAFLNVLIKTA